VCTDALPVHNEIIDDKGNWLAPKVTSKIPKKWIQKEVLPIKNNAIGEKLLFTEVAYDAKSVIVSIKLTKRTNQNSFAIVLTSKVLISLCVWYYVHWIRNQWHLLYQSFYRYSSIVYIASITFCLRRRTFLKTLFCNTDVRYNKHSLSSKRVCRTFTYKSRFELTLSKV